MLDIDTILLTIPLFKIKNPKQNVMTELAEQLLELATKGGAEAAEVFQARSYSQPIFF